MGLGHWTTFLGKWAHAVCESLVERERLACKVADIFSHQHRLPYNTQGPSLDISDIGALDSNAYAEPMELYDSIFWGKPSPTTTLYL